MATKRDSRGRFLKRGRSRHAPRRKVVMAKRRSRRFSRARSYGRRAAGFGRGLFGGKFGPIISGAVAGLAASTLAGRIPYAQPIAYGGVGYFTGNSTLMTLAGIQAAQLIPNPLAGGGGSGGFI